MSNTYSQFNDKSKSIPFLDTASQIRKHSKEAQSHWFEFRVMFGQFFLGFKPGQILSKFRLSPSPSLFRKCSIFIVHLENFCRVLQFSSHFCRHLSWLSSKEARLKTFWGNGYILLIFRAVLVDSPTTLISSETSQRIWNLFRKTSLSQFLKDVFPQLSERVSAATKVFIFWQRR